MIKMGNVPTISLAEDDSPTLARWIDVSSIELDESTRRSWIQAFPYREYSHPLHGKLSFNMDRAMRFADNVKKQIRGQDLDIDYDHKEKSGEAAGWIKDAEARSDGLYIFVEWTKSAFQKLKEGAYRYFSPEYVDSWTHPETGVKHNDVLFGGALTNRPFLKGILPINLSEMVGEPGQGGQGTEGGNQVNREQLEALAKNLGVSFTAETSDEDLYAAIAEATSEEDPGENEETEEEQETEEEENEPDPEAVLASEQTLKKLAETNPAVAVLLAEREANNRRISTLETANKLGSINVKLSELGNDKFKLAPKHTDKLRKVCIKLSESTANEVLDTVKAILKDGIVELGERGGRGGIQLDGDPAELFEAECRKLTEGENGMSYADAVEQVARDNEELYAAYRDSAFAGKE